MRKISTEQQNNMLVNINLLSMSIINIFWILLKQERNVHQTKYELFTSEIQKIDSCYVEDGFKLKYY